MDIVRFYQDFGITHKSEGHKHCRPGWVNTKCPFCISEPGHEGFHLGWNLKEEYYYCWRCGWHSIQKTVSILLNESNYYKIAEILKRYEINRTFIEQVEKSKKEFKLPTNSELFFSTAFNYLQNRNFNPSLIKDLWGIRITGPVSKLGNYDYRFRIIIPYYWNSEIVTFDARDYTGKAINKYYACPEEYELIPRKHILYGNQEMWNPELGICVEGPTDVWRLGSEAFAVSGIQYTHEQVRVMASIFKKIAVVFDNELQAQAQAKKLVAELRFRGVNAGIVEVSDDPGSLTNKEAKELLEIIKTKVK